MRRHIDKPIVRLSRVCFPAVGPVTAAMILSEFLGTWAGTALLNTIPERAFMILFKTVITLLALRLLYAAMTTT